MPASERATRVAFQGELGAFGHAAVGLFDPHAEAVPVRTFAEVIGALRRGVVSAGVLPIENTIVGTVGPSVEALLAAHDTVIVDEVTVPVRLCILGLPGATLATIGEVHSQEIALAQCRDFLSRHPHIATRVAHDTAGAARHVAQVRDVRVAAVASERAAQRYGLAVLAAGVEDRSDNVTRFAVVTLGT